MKRIRKGDQVVVTTGRNKGARGEVLRVDGDRVFVANVNIVKRHTKPNPQIQQPGGIIEKEASIHISNVMPFNIASGKGERIGHKLLKSGEGDRQRKARVFRSDNEMLDT